MVWAERAVPYHMKDGLALNIGLMVFNHQFKPHQSGYCLLDTVNSGL
jgi:hypothetical protein